MLFVDKDNLAPNSSVIMDVNERWSSHLNQFGETDGAIWLLGTNYIFGKKGIVKYTKELLMSVPQVVPYDGYEKPPTEVVSTFYLCVFIFSYNYLQ